MKKTGGSVEDKIKKVDIKVNWMLRKHGKLIMKRDIKSLDCPFVVVEQTEVLLDWISIN